MKKALVLPTCVVLDMDDVLAVEAGRYYAHLLSRTDPRASERVLKIVQSAEDSLGVVFHYTNAGTDDPAKPCTDLQAWYDEFKAADKHGPENCEKLLELMRTEKCVKGNNVHVCAFGNSPGHWMTPPTIYWVRSRVALEEQLAKLKR